MKCRARIIFRWWLEGGVADIMAFWVTACMVLMYLLDEIDQVPEWSIISWTLILLGWVYYRLNNLVDRLCRKPKEKENNV